MSEAKVKYVVLESPVHGWGLFAAEDIQEGEIIGEFELEQGEQGPYYWGHGLVVFNDLKFANSSMYPTKKGRRFVEDKSATNAIRRDMELVATRNIKAGDEILWPYVYYVGK